MKNKKEPNSKSSAKDKIPSNYRPEKSNMDDRMIYESLELQNILRNSSKQVINHIIKNGKIVVYKKGKIITKQGDTGDKVFFILRGNIEVLINDRNVAVRGAKECVGEMSVIDPTQNRCATLKALDDVTLLSLPFECMSNLLKTNKTISRNVAIELCSRLRERSKYYKCPNSTPKIFIGSSKEKVNIARKIKNKISFAEPVLWEKDVFNPSETTIVDLERQTNSCDFALLLFTPDDKVITRGKTKDNPRDNIIFELGLFMGAIGRDRTFILTREGAVKNLNFPSDLSGITFLTYKNTDKNPCLEDAIEALKIEIEQKGAK